VSLAPQGMRVVPEARGAEARRLAAWVGRLGPTGFMLRNSLYLVFSSGLQAALGFAFWIFAARLFTPDETGRASSLISASLFISMLALLGLNNSFIRYLPAAKNRDALITGGLCIVTTGAVVLAALYVLAAPTVAPRLAFVEQRLPLAIGFMLLTAASSVNLLTDAVFIGSNKAGYIALTDGAVAGMTKIAVLVMLAGFGSFGLYTASTTGLAAAALVSVILIVAHLGWRPEFRDSLTALRPLVRFSSASYATEFLSIIPQSVLPLIVLDRLGAAAAAYYYVSYQVAALTFSASYAVQATTLAEGSRDGVDLRTLVNRSIRLMVIVALPAIVVVIVCARWILLVFGARYSAHGTDALIVLVTAGVPIAAVGLIETPLRLLGRLHVIVWSSVLFAAVTCGFAWLFAGHGLVAVAAAWPIGTALSALSCAVPLLRRRPVSARHGRCERGARAPGDQPGRDIAGTESAGSARVPSLVVGGSAAPIPFRFGDIDGPSPRKVSRPENDSEGGQSGALHRYRVSIDYSSRPRLTAQPDSSHRQSAIR
jgi:O-antigen/teichoic acid export membrane protein